MMIWIFTMLLYYLNLILLRKLRRYRDCERETLRKYLTQLLPPVNLTMDVVGQPMDVDEIPMRENEIRFNQKEISMDENVSGK
jgi:hypothetical protein